MFIFGSHTHQSNDEMFLSIMIYLSVLKVSEKRIVTQIAQCGNFKIFISLRFYVKSILWILEVQKLPFLQF